MTTPQETPGSVANPAQRTPAALPKAPPVDPRLFDYKGDTGVNGFAVAGVILAMLGGVLGVVFCFVALSQISGTRQSGRGMAIAGLVISGVWILVFALGAIVAMT